MLSKFDDYPIHQTPEPIAHPATSDRNAYDRYWFNGYAPDGEFYFGVGMAIYPHRRILDGAFSIVHDGEQHAFHVSRRAPREPSDTAAGPYRVEVLEPMRRVRVVLEPNATGIECDLVFSARTACIEEGRQTLRRDERVIMDSTRFAQLGRWQGEIRYAGRTIPVDGSRVLGTKDRSWGVRPVGEPEVGGAPSASVPQVFFLWAPIHWEDRGTHFGLFEEADGHRWHQGGAIVPVYASPDAIPGTEDPAIEVVPNLDYRLKYQKGTRRMAEAELIRARRGGEPLRISLEPLLCHQMKGLGYLNPRWGHGVWKGELEIGGEAWKCDDLDPLALENLHVQQVVRARQGDREGVGVLEQLCLGAHAPSGFREMLDGAA